MYNMNKINKLSVHYDRKRHVFPRFLQHRKTGKRTEIRGENRFMAFYINDGCLNALTCAPSSSI